MALILGQHVTQAVADKIADLNLTNEIFVVEADKTKRRKEFSSFYVDNLGNVQRIGVHKDAELDVLLVTHADVLAEVPAVNKYFPTAADLNTYVQTIKDAIDNTMPFANIALVEYRIDATDVEPTAVFIKRYDETYLVSRKGDIFPAVVPTVEELKAILEPTDGLKVQVGSFLPDVVIYTFNSAATSGLPATDGTAGNWNAGIDHQYSFANIINNATCTATDGDASLAIDGDKTTDWVTSAANPEFEFAFAEPTKLAQYSFERVSTDDFDKDVDGDPKKWTLQAKDVDGVWQTIDSRETMVHRDVGPMTFRLGKQIQEYTEFKFVFDNADPIQLTEIGVAEAISNDQIKITTVDEADL